jgi:chemotaxis protein CheD
MTLHHVGIGEIAAASSGEDRIRTLALGSCVALIMLDPSSRCVGMAHIALPDSAVSADDAQKRPGHFANLAVPALLRAMALEGASTDTRAWIVKLVGGASVINAGNSFDIGRRNALAIKRALWERRMGAIAEDLGGNHSRNVELDVSEGRVRISSPGRGEWEI